MHLAKYGLAALVFALAACQAAPPPPSVAKAPAALAAEALEKGDYAKAADLYRSALAVEPESLPLHYGLGVAASYLDRRAEAVREFTWVLNRGETNSAEVNTARVWLLSVGALPRSAPTPTVLDDDDKGSGPRPAEQKPAPASVQGRVVFAPGETQRERMALFLYDYPSRVVYFRMRIDEEGRFRFANVPPGIYKLTDRAAGPPTWRLKVELKPGQDLTMDLDQSNSTRFRDDFPESTQAVVPRS